MSKCLILDKNSGGMLIVHHTAKVIFEGIEVSRIDLTLCKKPQPKTH